MQNLLAHLPTSRDQEEQIQNLVESEHVRIERIVSTGQASPPGFWYDQPQAEWVVVLQGEAKLMFEDSRESLHLQTGDWVEIAARRRHRVDWTSPSEPTVWLAVFYEQPPT